LQGKTEGHVPIDLKQIRDWQPPADMRRIWVLDAHTAGEPLRILIDGLPSLQSKGILSCRREWMERHDWLRKALMWEPRGHADMYGCVVIPPATDDGDFGVLFLHNDGYSSMCGHGIIAVVTALIETGVLPAAADENVYRIDSPAGRIVARAVIARGRVERVSFENVPSFVVELGASVEVPDLGRVTYDLAFGGAFYAFVDTRQFGVAPKCNGAEAEWLIRHGRAIKHAVMGSRAIEHPREPDLGFLYGTIFVAPPHDSGNHARNVCVFANGEVDRSPTGTGVSGLAAIRHARGELLTGESIRIESILGTTMDVQVDRNVDSDGIPAVIPVVTGQAYLTGRSEFWIDLRDPLHHGFLLR
jgi:trans-L-3-hydroxyproline dehydratase